MSEPKTYDPDAIVAALRTWAAHAPKRMLPARRYGRLTLKVVQFQIALADAGIIEMEDNYVPAHGVLEALEALRGRYSIVGPSSLWDRRCRIVID